MPEKDPTTYSLITYAWVFALSMWGGLAGYIRKVREGITTRFNLTELIGELMVSGFAGVITFFLGELSGFPVLLTAALCGIAGHMGSRALFQLERLLTKKFGLGE